MTAPPAAPRKAYWSSLVNAGLTVTNFAMVLLGLLAIARFGNARLDTGVVNVWSIWGIAHVSVGQSLQVLTALPGNDEKPLSQRFPLVLGAVAIGAFAVLLLRARLFPNLDANWPAAALVAIAAASVSGLLRGSLVRNRKATLSLGVVCAENAARSLLLLFVLWRAVPDSISSSGSGLQVSDSVVPWAIVAPFLVSIPVLVWLHLKSTYERPEDQNSSQATAGRAALTMIPSLASYALVPMLSVLQRLPEAIEVDALAFDAALARGPVQVAVFAAPIALQYMLDRSGGSRTRVAGVPVCLFVTIGALGSTLLFVPESVVGRLLLVVLVGSVSLVAYGAILDAVDRSASALAVITTMTAAFVAFLISATLVDEVSLAPVAWASAAAVWALVVTSTSNDGQRGVPGPTEARRGPTELRSGS